jgi:hypothetical protein
MKNRGNQMSNQDLTPWQCKKQACGFQTCITKHNYMTDPIKHCRPYYLAYEECMEQHNRSATTEPSENNKSSKALPTDV